MPDPTLFANPVYPRDFPDPFVLRHAGRYYAYATGIDGDRRFPMLSSTDLVNWEPHGGALDPLDAPGTEEYWAPEVAYHDGRFYMYYATGHTADPDHHLRLAVADHPLGPWTDAAVDLTPRELFAIDAHPFQDPEDGQWYLFYARDELDPPYAGTGIVVDRLLAMDRLEGDPKPVLRPYAAWQVFELQRKVKKGLDWYTIEGPYVLRVDGKYVCFYSGGRYENPNYGVGYALADHPLGPYTDDANAELPQILLTVPNKVIGPGHNSVTLGPDLVTPYLVYHGWDPEGTARYPRIDVLTWNGARPICHGPTSDPQPAPRLPDLLLHFDQFDPATAGFALPPGWKADAKGLHATLPRILPLVDSVGDFVLELSGHTSDAGAEWGLLLSDLPIGAMPRGLEAGTATVQLPPGYRSTVHHQLTVRRQSGVLTATLDAHPTVTLELPDNHRWPLSLTATPGATLTHLALTHL